MFDIFTKTPSKNTFLLIHFAIFGIGLLKLAQFIAFAVYGHFDFTPYTIIVNDWMGKTNPGKLPQLLYYTGAIVALLGAFVLFLASSYQSPAKLVVTLQNKTSYVISYWVFIFALNILFLNDYGFWIKSFLFVVWITAFLWLPLFYLYPEFDRLLKRGNLKAPISNTIYILLIALVSLQFFFVFYPLLFKQIPIENEYLDIPEKTLLKNNKVVDNTTFINTHHIGGLVKYDPRIDEGNTFSSPFTNTVTLSFDPMLDYFIQFKSSNRKYRYAYDKDKHVLSLRGVMSEKEYKELLLLYSGHPKDKEAIKQLFVASLKKAQFHEKRIYDDEEKDFLQKNGIELTNQVRAGWSFFHHSWMLNPIHAVSLGASWWTQPLIYGLGSALTAKKIMEFLGGINYQNYFKVLYAFYPVYYALFLFALYRIFRRVDYVFIGAIFLCCCTLGLSYEIIRIAPGCNPMRHFFDMIVFLLFYSYLKKPNKLDLYSSLTLCLLSVLWSKDFGFCLLLAICGASIIRIILHERITYGKLIPFVLVGLLGCILYLLPINKNPNAIYMLLGYGAPGTPSKLVSFALILIGTGWLVYARLIRTNSPMLFLSLGLFLYSELILVYFLWYPSYHHLLISMMPVVALLLTWIALYENKQLNNPRLPPIPISLCSIGLLAFIYLPTVMYFYYGQLKHEQIFKTHVVYDWQLKNASFKSTMEPELFQQSAALINQYEQHKNVYLISKYDSLLTILADKYNAIPTVNLALDLITTKDIQRFYDAVTTNSPQYIFMDTDIARNFNGDIFHPKDPAARKNNYILSLGRAGMLTNIKKLYSKLITQYEPMAKQGLLTVYRKKATTHEVYQDFDGRKFEFRVAKIREKNLNTITLQDSNITPE